jgi:8-oxo-dGTP pyrophosphatase MutT (NUDIX family)
MDMHPKKIGAGILMIDAETGDLLLGRRGFNNTHTANMWAPFGGTWETKDGHPKVTAQREFEEESGINVPYTISSSPFYINDDNHLTFYTYLGTVKKKFHVAISGESLGYGWFPLDKLPHNLLPGFAEMISDNKEKLEKITLDLIKSDTDIDEAIKK